MAQTCSVAGCETTVRCRGLCKKHYVRWQRHGDPTVVVLPSQRRKRRPMSPADCAAVSAGRKRYWASPAGQAAKVARSAAISGSLHPQWKEVVGYQAAHCRVYAARGRPEVCEHCGTSGPDAHMEWASVNRDYLNVDDYISLCKSCHNRFDGIADNLKKAQA